MTPLGDTQVAGRQGRRRLRQAEETLHRDMNRLAHVRVRLDSAERQGEAAADAAGELRAEVRELSKRVRDARDALAGARLTLVDLIARVERPQDLVEEIDDRTPILLLPVRVETRFMPGTGGTELWVRVFPDDVAAPTHEEQLTEDEVAAGVTFWTEVWAASRESEDADQRRARERGAWRVLAGELGGPRARWVALRTEPESLDVEESEALVFPVFEPGSIKDDTWTRAPRTNVMPDRFVVMTFSGGELVHEVVGQPIPRPLKLGPEPQSDDDLSQVEGDLTASEELAWVLDFDEAVRAGMGVRIPLQAPHVENGFDRVIVLGLLLSADAEESAELVTELLGQHLFSPDGLEVLSQGTPTNNTGAGPSGFSSIDRGARESFELVSGDPQFLMTDDRRLKSDGQRLSEALGIAEESLQAVPGAGQQDVSEAIAMNIALWPATGGYFLEELLGVSPAAAQRTRQFFIRYVTGRSPLPAIRAGAQPYGVLPTSSLSRWRWSSQIEGRDLPFLEQMERVIDRFDAEWERHVADIARVGADGDPWENLLAMIGLHASSVEWHRRRGTGRGYLWNYQRLSSANEFAVSTHQSLLQRARAILAQLGLGFDETPDLFKTTFFTKQDDVTDPLVDDVGTAEEERWSEEVALPRRYRVPGQAELVNYIEWLLLSDIRAIKVQDFRDAEDQRVPIPKALLYRLLRHALLLAYHAATVRIYVNAGTAEPQVAREVELPNVGVERTVTRWELMEAPLQVAAPGLSEEVISVAGFLQTPAGLVQSEADELREVRSSLSVLAELPTARLERLFAEHVDLCSYRLDAWQTAMIARRLEQHRLPVDDGSTGHRSGIHLGSFGWLEELRPGPPAREVDPEDLPEPLRDPEAGPITEPVRSGGFIHGPSLNHAVTAAILRSAYLSHADVDRPERMAVNLSSERVRSALRFLEGIRNGQELGALLGYQFERGLHERHGLLDGVALNEFVQAFRERYPLLADTVTPDADGHAVSVKEARNVFDGFKLYEAVFLKDPPAEYPFDVPGLPPSGSEAADAIQAEVDRMVGSMDAVADLALAEGVYQVAQGNYDRGGSMIRALTQGANPPEPEIARTPRSGTSCYHRIALHVAPGEAESVWPADPTARSRAEPGLNRWLGELLGSPSDIRFIVETTIPGEVDVSRSVADLGLQPIDLVLLAGEEVGTGEGGGRTSDDTTRLESRIAYAYRRLRRDADGIADLGELRVVLLVRDPSWPATAKTVFEILPLLRALRTLLAACRPLAADDYRLPSETVTDPDQEPNPSGIDLAALTTRADGVRSRFSDAVDRLGDAASAAAAPGAGVAELEELRGALEGLADHGVPGSLPRDAVGASAEVRDALLLQAESVSDLARDKLARAGTLIDGDDLEPDELAGLSIGDRAERIREAMRELIAVPFGLLPEFRVSNAPELAAAAAFRDAPHDAGLLRFSASPLVVEEWLHGAQRVREKVGELETVRTLAFALAGAEVEAKALQLPFREADHWIAVAYPTPGPNQAFVPEGEFLSLIQVHSAPGFDPSLNQVGLVVDEWPEVIPSSLETTGIAIHYDQPSSEPPQCLLLAVTPEETGSWTWSDLVAVLNDTVDRAKKRGVEPDHLGRGAFGHLLPAVITAVAAPPFSTISADLLYETGSATLEFDT